MVRALVCLIIAQLMLMRGAYVICNFLGSEDTSRSTAAENIDIIADEADGAGGTVILASAFASTLGANPFVPLAVCHFFIRGAAFEDLTRISLQLAIYFLLCEGKAIKRLQRANCAELFGIYRTALLTGICTTFASAAGRMFQ
jgi:hypothetical protein